MTTKKPSPPAKHPSSKFFLILVIFLLGLAVATSAGIIGYVSYHRDNIVTEEFIESVSEKDMFSYNNVDGWWQGESSHTSIVLLGEQNHDACFVTAEYKPGQVKAEAELQDNRDKLADFGADYQLKQLETKSMSLKTDAEPIKYDLYQSEIVVPAKANKARVKTGQQFGFINLDEGHVKLQGLCDKASQLDGTLEAIEAIVFHQP